MKSIDLCGLPYGGDFCTLLKYKFWLMLDYLLHSGKRELTKQENDEWQTYIPVYYCPVYELSYLNIYRYVEILTGFEDRKMLALSMDLEVVKNDIDQMVQFIEDISYKGGDVLEPYQWVELEKQCNKTMKYFSYALSLLPCRRFVGEDAGSQHIELKVPISPQLEPILQRGQEAGYLDDKYKPIPGVMTLFQQKRFALLACIEARMDNYCSVFGRMWNHDYNGVDESRGARKKREAIDSLFEQDVIKRAKLK